MQFLTSSIFWLFAFALSSFTILPILIMLVFGIPTTRKLARRGLLKENNRIVKGYFVSMAILTGVYLTVLFLVVVFIPGSASRGFIGGSFFPVLFGLFQLGRNKNNVSEYLRVNERHFKAPLVEIGNEIMR